MLLTKCVCDMSRHQHQNPVIKMTFWPIMMLMTDGSSIDHSKKIFIEFGTKINFISPTLNIFWKHGNKVWIGPMSATSHNERFLSTTPTTGSLTLTDWVNNKPMSATSLQSTAVTLHTINSLPKKLIWSQIR